MKTRNGILFQSIAMYSPQSKAKHEKIYSGLKKKFSTVKKGEDYRAHSGKVHSISWNSTGNRIASCSSDKTVSVFDFDGTKLSRSPTCLRGGKRNLIANKRSLSAFVLL